MTKERKFLSIQSGSFSINGQYELCHSMGGSSQMLLLENQRKPFSEKQPTFIVHEHRFGSALFDSVTDGAWQSS